MIKRLSIILIFIVTVVTSVYADKNEKLLAQQEISVTLAKTESSQAITILSPHLNDWFAKDEFGPLFRAFRVYPMRVQEVIKGTVTASDIFVIGLSTSIEIPSSNEKLVVKRPVPVDGLQYLAIIAPLNTNELDTDKELQRLLNSFQHTFHISSSSFYTLASRQSLYEIIQNEEFYSPKKFQLTLPSAALNDLRAFFGAQSVNRTPSSSTEFGQHLSTALNQTAATSRIVRQSVAAQAPIAPYQKDCVGLDKDPTEYCDCEPDPPNTVLFQP